MLYVENYILQFFSTESQKSIIVFWLFFPPPKELYLETSLILAGQVLNAHHIIPLRLTYCEIAWPGLGQPSGKEYKEEGQCAQKWGRMLVFVICGFIKNFSTNSYFILHVHLVKGFKMRHYRYLYFNFSVRYS